MNETNQLPVEAAAAPEPARFRYDARADNDGQPEAAVAPRNQVGSVGEQGTPPKDQGTQPTLEELNRDFPVNQLGSEQWRTDMMQLPFPYWVQIFTPVATELGVDANLLADYVKKCIQQKRWANTFHVTGADNLDPFVQADLMIPIPSEENHFFRPTAKLCQIVSDAITKFESDGGKLTIAQ